MDVWKQDWYSLNANVDCGTIPIWFQYGRSAGHASCKHFEFNENRKQTDGYATMLALLIANELVGTTSLIKLWNTDINVNVEQNCQLDRTLLVGTPGSTLTGTSYTLYQMVIL